MSPEQRAREEIDRLLTAAGWSVADVAQGDLRASRRVTMRAYGPQRARCGWQLDDCFECEPKELNSTVRTPDQIRGITRTQRDRWRRDLLLQREVVFKTPAFAEFDNQVGAIVEIPCTESAQKFNHCTADLPAAGTDMKSRSSFERMKGRGLRVNTRPTCSERGPMPRPRTVATLSELS